jgi:hypothetical protein
MSQRMLTVGTILLVGVLHLPAVQNDWYFYFWWYDVMMHALGGFATGFLAMTLWSELESRSVGTWRSFVLQLGFVIGLVALVGIGWEWLEAVADAILLPRLNMTNAQLGLADTMLDLYFDLFGGFVAWLVLNVRARKEGR